MDQNALVSIIVPAYNAAGSIEATLRSILSQTYSHFECIVIDDGSKDETISIVQRISQQDARIRFFSFENSGPAAARNRGLTKISPESQYVMFCDADDLFVPQTVEQAVSASQSACAEFVIFGFTIQNPDGTCNHYFEPNGVYTHETFGSVLTNLYKANLLNQVWGKLYRADLIRKNGISFLDYRWGEDRFFNFDVLERAQKVAVISSCNYQYLMHVGESLITGYYDKKPDVCIEIDERIRKLCSIFHVEDNGFFRYMFAKSIFSCFTSLYSPSCKMQKPERISFSKRVLKNESVQTRCRNTEGGFSMKVICGVIQSGQPLLVLLLAKGAVAASKTAPKLFQKLKHKK